jgi:periplasmic divalent cation tolerance protein
MHHGENVASSQYRNPRGLCVTTCCQVTTTLPDQATAERLAAAVVEERLAACAQVQGPISSTYRWEGSIERGTEWYCHLKTTERRLPALQARIGELHPYEVPEIIAVPILDGNADYLSWVEQNVR